MLLQNIEENRQATFFIILPQFAKFKIRLFQIKTDDKIRILQIKN